jgi:ribosomal protein L7/L12
MEKEHMEQIEKAVIHLLKEKTRRVFEEQTVSETYTHPKIMTIKWLRSTVEGLGLKESKEFVEEAIGEFSFVIETDDYVDLSNAKRCLRSAKLSVKFK